MAANYIWPLSKGTTPDETNTSFGSSTSRITWRELKPPGPGLPGPARCTFPPRMA